MNNDKPLRTFLEIPYDELEEMNIRATKKAKAESYVTLEKEYRSYLLKEKNIKAITLCFSDIEGKFHMIDYDKKFLLNSAHNLTFDGSSVRGFTALRESDLRLRVDWASIRWLPSDVFGPGKIIMFADVLNRNKTAYESDMRLQLKLLVEDIQKKQGLTPYASVEVEGFLMEGINTEQQYHANTGFKLVTSGGYYHSLPLDKLRMFIDRSAEAQRAMGFSNEKDHPEVAPSQFELNFSYDDVVRIGDQIQLYKLVCRQVASSMGMTATFLPKPITGVNGSGMHLNLSYFKNQKNIFYKKDGNEGLSSFAWEAIEKILNHASELCLILNSSVNAYRRLDPKFEAPNQIKVSPIDRGSMIRIPVGDEKSSRIEIRSVAPDSNPYLVLFSILKTIQMGKRLQKAEDKRERVRLLPDNIYDAIRIFKSSEFVSHILGDSNKEKYVEHKQLVADRSPKNLGNRIKTGEVIYHHEVTNQMLWNTF